MCALWTADMRSGLVQRQNAGSALPKLLPTTPANFLFKAVIPSSGNSDQTGLANEVIGRSNRLHELSDRELRDDETWLAALKCPEFPADFGDNDEEETNDVASEKEGNGNTY